MLISEENIFVDLKAHSRDDLFRFLADCLLRAGFVKASYYEALLDREKVTPTGMQTQSIGIAIPHTDRGHVLKPQIAVATLKSPIVFHRMEDPKLTLDVSLVFMLAVNNPDDQIDLLSKLADILSDGALLLKIQQCKEPIQILKYLQLLNQ